MPTLKNLQQKVTIITGAGKGTGRSLALAFAAQGAWVAANDITPINLDTLIAEIRQSGGTARPYVADIAKKVGVQALLNEVQDDYGRIDILVNCANVQPRAPLLEIDEWDLHRVFEVNTLGALLMMQSAGRMMRQQGSGIILNLLDEDEQAPLTYTASLAALQEATQRAAQEFAPYGISVLALPKKQASQWQSLLP
jgi:NAD(P)-dependent dehydrogenase (short-subunit alcohol dehydrogenase family)